jgi:nitrite reductase (NADH) small subunit
MNNIVEFDMTDAGQTQVVLCSEDDLIAGSGVCVLHGTEQIALFWLPDEEPALYAIGNFDPLGDANVLSRGIVGDLNGTLVVASPLYKQHYALETGQCLEDETVTVPVYRVGMESGLVYLFT